MQTRLSSIVIAAGALLACESPRPAAEPAPPPAEAAAPEAQESAAPALAAAVPQPAPVPLGAPAITSAEIEDAARRLATEIASSPQIKAFARLRQRQASGGSDDIVARLVRIDIRADRARTMLDRSDEDRIVTELEYALAGALASNGVVLQAERDPRPAVPGKTDRDPVTGTALKAEVAIDLTVFVDQAGDPPPWAVRARVQDIATGTTVVTASVSTPPAPR